MNKSPKTILISNLYILFLYSIKIHHKIKYTIVISSPFGPSYYLVLFKVGNISSEKLTYDFGKCDGDKGGWV
jgi:hypothetical protein